MRMVNHTSWPDLKIREMIEFAATPLNIKTMKITCEPYLKNDDGFSVQGRKEIDIEIRPDGKERYSYPYVNDFSTAVGYHITKRIGNWAKKDRLSSTSNIVKGRRYSACDSS